MTTNPGIEDIVIREVEEKIGASVSIFHNLPGKLITEINKGEIYKVFSLRSIYHAVKYLSMFEIRTSNEGLLDIYKNLKELEIEEMESANTFRVTSQRIGEHSFTSIQVQKYAGQAIVDKYKKKVDLENFDVNIICDIVGSRCYIGIQLTRESLHKRFERPFDHPAAIKTPLAYGMLRMADVRDGDTLLDPFCGGGTILIEAAQIWDGRVKILGSDINSRFLDGASKNIKAAGVERHILLKTADARRLNEYYSVEIDKIVTNPPYGVRLGRERNLKGLYWDFLNSASKIMKSDGRIVIINLKATAFRSLVLKAMKFKLVHERVVETGGLYPHIFVLEKI
ncbi:MAG: THUMP domain-containing protein [Nitrososphaerota archaeon]|nr:THUMP domain-containing protein [Nitrososphaerota archaeon]